jgi:hydroxyethylthiazole kinase-like uncharacterized protein yjeF
VSESFRLVSVDEMRALEGAAVQAGTAERELQERAGIAIADVVTDEITRPGRIEALVGRGNNGRDAMVAARNLARRGWATHLWLAPGHTVEPHELSSLSTLGVTWSPVSREGETPGLEISLSAADVVLDGLLGVGARGPMRAPLSGVAETVNRVTERGGSPLVVAVDVPSGIDADTGEASGATVRADITVTLGAVKTGLFHTPASDLMGRLEVRGIGIQPEALKDLPYRILTDDARPALPARSTGSHKYNFGRLLIVGGSARYVGAPYLAAAAGARSGAGLIMLAAPESVQRVASIQLPEATYTEQWVEPERDPDTALNIVVPLLSVVNAIVIGPGLGRSDGANAFLRGLLVARGTLESPPPMVLDGDALSLLGDWPEWPDVAGANLVLTPHHGEMGRLLNRASKEIAIRPWEIARSSAVGWQQVVTLKGPFTAIAQPGGETWVYPRANAALATAGTGDVLAGTIGGLLAQGMAPAEAARLGVWAHAAAAREIIRRHSWRTLLASDLLLEIPRVLAGPSLDRKRSSRNRDQA